MSNVKSQVEQIIVRQNDSNYPVFIRMAHIANNIFNASTYAARQWYIFDRTHVSLTKLNKYFKRKEQYKENCLYTQMNAQMAQQIFRSVNSNFKAFFRAMKQWFKHPEKFTGRPKLPYYHHKGGVSTFWIDNQDFRFDPERQMIRFHSTSHAKWWKRHLHPIFLGHYAHISHVGQITVVPKKYYVQLLISYKVTVPDTVPDNHRYMGIDPGVNNLLCCGFNDPKLEPFIVNGRLVKSINQRANKRIAQTQRCLKICNHKYTSRYLDHLFNKRHFRLYYLCHEASKYVVASALSHNISRIIIGSGATRSKQHSNMGKRNNQNFVSIPFRQLIMDIQYKAETKGIKVIITEESYTSQSSFLDQEKPCKANGNLARKAKGIKNWKRRIKRGLYHSDSGQNINADLNGALQIIKKVFPKAFAGGINGFVTSPVKINL